MSDFFAVLNFILKGSLGQSCKNYDNFLVGKKKD